MRCPFCRSTDNHVVDSRTSREGGVIRRRRECEGCHRRFTTHERLEDVPILVIKKDGQREPFDRHKVTRGIFNAAHRRPVSADAINDFVNELDQKIADKGLREIDSSWIGEEVMRFLHEIDQVAYVRFASVYREFKDISEFMDELSGLLRRDVSKPRKAQETAT